MYAMYYNNMSKYTAIIVEPRKHHALSFVVHNFLQNLSDDWNIIIFHGNQNIEFIETFLKSESFQPYIHRISLENLHVDNITIDDYNNLFINNREFYEKIPTETFLVFQTDTMIFEKNKHLINVFLDYDYVGAPWLHYPVEGENVGNGGLSLRKKSKMLEIMENSFDKDLPEDVFFSCPTNVSIYKPQFEIAKLFSVEEEFSYMTFGCHKVWEKSCWNEFYELYPETKILADLQDW